MIYRETLPRPALRGQVACIWVLEHPADPRPRPEKILPDGNPELIFNFGAPYSRVGSGAATPQPRSFVVGQIERYMGFDQAHLCREFRAFAGEPPAAFLSSQHELSDHLTGLAAV